MAKKKATQNGNLRLSQYVISSMGICSVIISNITHYS